MNAETKLHRSIMLALGHGGSRVFRNNVGVGLFVDGNQEGAARLLQGAGFGVHRVRFGLCPGSSDLIGWQTVTVTQDMVGQRMAVFLAVEAKGTDGRLLPAQGTFLKAVQDAGGVGGMVRTVEEARRLLWVPQ